MTVRFGVSMSEYLSMEALGSSIAFEAISRSPLHAKHKASSDSWAKAADVGTVTHQMLLEGGDVHDCAVIVDAKDWRTKAARESRDAAYTDNKTPILACQVDGIRQIVGTARRFIESTELAGVFGGGQPEVTIDWEDHGIVCKARPDYLSSEFHVSVKTTTADAEPEGWARRCMRPYGYDFGLMFYQRGLLANGIDVKQRILVIEQNPPYAASVIALATDKEAILDSLVDEAIRTWANCLKTATFPGYSTQTHFAEASPWELADAELRELKSDARGA